MPYWITYEDPMFGGTGWTFELLPSIKKHDYKILKILNKIIDDKHFKEDFEKNLLAFAIR